MGGTYSQSQGNRTDEDKVVDDALIDKKDGRHNNMVRQSDYNNTGIPRYFKCLPCLCFKPKNRKNYRLEVDTNEFVHVFESTSKLKEENIDEQNEKNSRKNQVIDNQCSRVRLPKSLSDHDNLKSRKNGDHIISNNELEKNIANKCMRSVSLKSFCRFHNNMKTQDILYKLLSKSVEYKNRLPDVEFVAIPNYFGMINENFREDYGDRESDNNVDQGRYSSERQTNLRNINSLDYFEKSEFHQIVPLLNQPNPPSSILYEETYIDNIDSPCIDSKVPLASMDTLDIGSSKDSLDNLILPRDNIKFSQNIPMNNTGYNYKFIDSGTTRSHSENPLSSDHQQQQQQWQHRSNVKDSFDGINNSVEEVKPNKTVRTHSLQLKPTTGSMASKTLPQQHKQQLYYSMVLNKQVSIPEHEGGSEIGRVGEASEMSINQMSITSDTIFNDINFTNSSMYDNCDSINDSTYDNITNEINNNNNNNNDDNNNNKFINNDDNDNNKFINNDDKKDSVVVSDCTNNNGNVMERAYIMLDVETYVQLMEELQHCRQDLQQLQQFILNDFEV